MTLCSSRLTHVNPICTLLSALFWSAPTPGGIIWVLGWEMLTNQPKLGSWVHSSVAPHIVLLRSIRSEWYLHQPEKYLSGTCSSHRSLVWSTLLPVPGCAAGAKAYCPWTKNHEVHLVFGKVFTQLLSLYYTVGTVSVFEWTEEDM